MDGEGPAALGSTGLKLLSHQVTMRVNVCPPASDFVS